MTRFEWSPDDIVWEIPLTNTKEVPMQLNAEQSVRVGKEIELLGHQVARDLNQLLITLGISPLVRLDVGCWIKASMAVVDWHLEQMTSLLGRYAVLGKSEADYDDWRRVQAECYARETLAVYFAMHPSLQEFCPEVSVGLPKVDYMIPPWLGRCPTN